MTIFCEKITSLSSSVIRQKGESLNGCLKKTKHVTCFVFLKHPFWDSPFCPITDELTNQKQPSISVPGKSDSEIMQQIYRRTLMPKFDFDKVVLRCKVTLLKIILWHGYSPVNFLHIFRTPFPKNASGGLLLTNFENFSM